MQIEAIYNQGKLEFSKPIKFLHKKFNLIVEIPDEDIIHPTISAETVVLNYQLPDEVITQAEAMEKELDSIRNAPYAASKDTTALTSKQEEGIKAFSLRNEVKDVH